MRAIKFRFIEKGKIVGYERHILIDGTISIQHQKVNESIWRFIYPDYKDWICHDHKEQYTGLKDKNDKDLDWWEGDILKSPEGKYYLVEYSERYCKFILSNNKGVYILALWVAAEKGYAKEGNIHENPELLV